MNSIVIIGGGHAAAQLCAGLAEAGQGARVHLVCEEAIPMMPLYLSLLFKVMKEEGTHEGCIEQVHGLYADSLYGATPHIDEEGRLRADYKELAPQVQSRVLALWPQVNDANLGELTDFAGYKTEFLRLFGFAVEGVDYDADVNPDVGIPGIVQL